VDRCRKQANVCRRGNIRTTANGHAFEYADATPCFLLGDTWWPRDLPLSLAHDDAPVRWARRGVQGFCAFPAPTEVQLHRLIAACPMGQ